MSLFDWEACFRCSATLVSKGFCTWLSARRGPQRVRYLTAPLTLTFSAMEELLLCVEQVLEGKYSLNPFRPLNVVNFTVTPWKVWYLTLSSSALFRSASLFSTISIISCSSSVRWLRSIMLLSSGWRNAPLPLFNQMSRVDMFLQLHSCHSRTLTAERMDRCWKVPEKSLTRAAKDTISIYLCSFSSFAALSLKKKNMFENVQIWKKFSHRL